MLCHRHSLQLYTIGELQSVVGDMKQQLMFVQAISVSAPYMKGKKRPLEVLLSYGDQDHLSTFTEYIVARLNIFQKLEKGSC